MRLAKKQVLFFVAACVMVAAGLRSYRLGYQSFWTDEIVTFLNSSGSTNEVMFNPVVNSNIPPLYYLIVHGVLELGHQEYVLRLPSVIFGALSVVLFFLVIRNWLGTRVALAGTGLMAISPFHIWYSQEARPYVLLLFLALLALWLLQLLLQNPKSIWLRAGFIVTSTATFYCHTVAAAFIGFLAFYAALARGRQNFGFWFLSFGAISLLLMPAVYLLVVTPPTSSADLVRSFNPLSIFYVVWTFCTGFSLGPTLHELHLSNRSSLLVGYLPSILPAVVLFSSLLLLGALRLWKDSRSAFWYVSSWFIFPLAFGVLGALLTVHPFNVRYVILSFPAIIIYLARGIEGLPNYKWRWTTYALVITVSGVSLHNYFHDVRYHRDDNRAAGQFLSSHALPNDLIIASAFYTAMNLRYYYGKEDVTIVGYPRRPRYDEITPPVRSDNPSLSSTSISRGLEEIVDGRQRFWLFLSRSYDRAIEGRIVKFCDQYFRRDLEASWNDSRLILYVKANGS